MNNQDHVFSIAKETAATNESSFWSSLYEAGKRHLNEIVVELQNIASRPGSAVFFGAHPLGAEGSPVLYSAIDLRTHLQIARLYFTCSAASSLDFIGFAQRSFPFPLQSILTKNPADLMGTGNPGAIERFTVSIFQLGMRHDICQGRSAEICELLKGYFFDGDIKERFDGDTEQRYINELRDYLFYHNQHRSFPSLEGRTALAALRAFAEYRSVAVFDSFHPVFHSR